MLGLSGVAAIVAGSVINSAARKLPWLLLAGANLSFLAGQVSFLIITQVIATTVPFPSFADVLYLLTFPLYAAGLLIFIRWRTAGDRQSLIDALTLTIGLALLSWTYLILPYVHNPALSWMQKSVAIAYPLGDILVLAMLARLLTPGSMGIRSVQLLTAGTIGMLASDVSFGVLQLYGSFRAGTAVDLGWAVFYGAWGAAALHPSMAELTRPGIRQQDRVSRLRLTLLLLAALIAPAVLFVQSLEFRLRIASVIAVFSAILYLLVLARLWGVAASHRRVRDREHALRLAGVSLASAGTVEEVAGAVRTAAAALSGSHPQHGVLLAVRDNGTLRAVDSDDDDATLARQRGELARAWLSRLQGSGPVLLSAAGLDPSARAQLPGVDGILLCPLTLRDRPAGDPFIGVLAVFGGQHGLGDLSATLESLAQQAALAVERIMLSREVVRQGSEAYFRTLVQDTSDAILIIGGDGEVRYATPSARNIFGDVSITGVCLWDLVRRDCRDQVRQALACMRGQVGERSHDEWRISRQDNEVVQVEVRCSDLRADSTVRGLVLTLRDVTEQRQLESTLKHRAFHDALTGLPNRLLFRERAARELARARRDGAMVGVLFVDLDDFKVVNDTMGHSVGDELLVAAGRRLSAAMRGSDTTARLGGDEFALLIDNLPDSAALDAFAGRVVSTLSEPFTTASGSAVTTATVGVASTEDSTDVDDLLSHADLALYAAKAAGKRRWCRYQPVLSAGLARRRELQTALDEAVTNSAFTLAYQPIVNLASGEVRGFEALVRWRHPRWGMMNPEQFIALAEETGHIVPLGSWVLQRAAADLTRWRGRGGRRTPLYVSVNVSARQFREPGFVDGVRQILRSSGLAPSSLMLELTESILLNPDVRTHADLTQLKDAGVRLAIDDFGTGYSSLSYLQELPIDVLKIDKSFVEGLAGSEQRQALVEGIIRIARTLQMDVTAEGIEKETERDLLISLGCLYGQGYLLAMPLAPAEAAALAAEGLSVIPELPQLGV
ncbi:MAG: putative bifunctional diguanylate cyclase/phosphodiesterase [Gemmatimonadota bacterium]